jgi:hypothetical protein
MLEQWIEQWIKDFEARFDESDNVMARDYKPTGFINDLRHKSKCLGVKELKTEIGTKQRLYCYIESNKQGVILERENDKVGIVVSYGNISLDDFTTNHIPFNQQKKSKARKYFWPAFIGAIIPVTYLGLKKFFGHREDEK